MSSMFNNNAYTCILFIALWWVVSLACTLLTCVLFNNLSKVDLIMKLSQIPAYIALLLIIFACLFTIFTFLISFLLMILLCSSVFLSGIPGIFSAKKLYDTGKISKDKFALYSILQLLAIANVISTIMLYKSFKIHDQPV